MGSVETRSGNGSETETLSRNDIFEVLSNRRRRFTLHYLQHHDGAEIGDVATQIAAWENDERIEEVASNERKTVYTALQQFHLGKMEEKGVVEFDRRAGTIELTDTADSIDIYLEVVDRYDIPWSYYYLGLSLLGTILVLLSWLDVPPFAGVPFSGWIVFLLATFLVSSVSHLYLSREMHLGNNETPPGVRP